eukprot:CCRYP_010958-RA/>CCRYP_010958-RA protein AED:0.06 eAED:0.06 QI:146/1/1/1/1/0.87/8/1857/795
MAAAQPTTPRPRAVLTFTRLIELLSLFTILVLFVLAFIVNQHAQLLLDPSTTAQKEQTQLQSVPPPPRSSKRIKNEISNLEKELEKVAADAMGMAEDIRTAMDIQKHSKGQTSLEGEAAFREREPKKWWVRRDPYPSFANAIKSSTSEGGAIIPVNLSVNHLQIVHRAPGSPNDNEQLHEEFLPVVLKDDIEFRWRSQSRAGSPASDIKQTTAYRIVVRVAHSQKVDDEGVWIWDSRRIETSGLPDVVKCTSKLIEAGSILEWKVMVWDASNRQSSSEWTKFAVGPENDEWTAKWITHPVDMNSWSKGDAGAFWLDKNIEAQEVACDNWNKRKQLPIFRAQVPHLEKVRTALLVVSGLGSFRTSLDGIPLSSSGPLDPPLTDFAQRVSYRGYDITPFLKDGQSHVIGIAAGSGWWDHRPIKGSFIRLFYFPHGPNTITAQVFVTYESGKREVLIPTGGGSEGWQVTKGHLRESSLFSGEYIDLGVMSTLDGWDTPSKWSEISSSGNKETWTKPTLYESDTTLELWRYQLHVKATAKRKDNRPSIPENKVAPIGKLVPHEAPPVLPMNRIYPDEIYSLGDGRWMIDFGVGFSGMVRFDEGLPDPIVPDRYPRGHSVSTLSEHEAFITVVYGERLELTTGDINLPLVAGMGLHDGGPKHKSKPAGNAEGKGGVCYPEDHVEAGSLMQRDVYILPKNGKEASPMLGSRTLQRMHFDLQRFVALLKHRKGCTLSLIERLFMNGVNSVAAMFGSMEDMNWLEMHSTVICWGCRVIVLTGRKFNMGGILMRMHRRRCTSLT